LLQAQDIMDETGLTQIWREAMQNCL